MLDLYEADFNPKWLQTAQEIQKSLDQNFWDKENFGYFYTDAKEIIVRKKEYYDSVIPSSNSVALRNLIRLNAYFASSSLNSKIEHQVKSILAHLKSFPFAYPKALGNLLLLKKGIKEVAIIRPKGSSLKTTFYQNILKLPINNIALSIVEEGESYPDIVAKRPLLNGKETFYVCENKICKLPTNDAEKAESLLESKFDS